jgi:hypothetical protein
MTSRLNVARCDFSPTTTPTEVHDLSICIDLEQLVAYSDAVVERTLEVVRGLHPEDLDAINDAAYVQQSTHEHDSKASTRLSSRSTEVSEAPAL